jgi:hypothetical protein
MVEPDEDERPAYHHKVSLRISHPAIDPSEITATLGPTPDHAWRAGEPRTGTRGQPGKGYWKKSYWCLSLAQGDAQQNDLPNALTAAVETLSPHRTFFERIRSEGGGVEFFIGWFMDRLMAGEILDCVLLRRIGELGIDLSFDIYERDNRAAATT